MHGGTSSRELMASMIKVGFRARSKKKQRVKRTHQPSTTAGLEAVYHRLVILTLRRTKPVELRLNPKLEVLNLHREPLEQLDCVGNGSVTRNAQSFDWEGWPPPAGEGRPERPSRPGGTQSHHGTAKKGRRHRGAKRVGEKGSWSELRKSDWGEDFVARSFDLGVRAGACIILRILPNLARQPDSDISLLTAW